MSSTKDELQKRTVRDFKYFMPYQTRWNDNDQYSHLNNSVYNLLFDTIINKYLVESCGLRPSSSTDPNEGPIGLVIESHASFLRPLSFPSRILLGMRVIKAGRSSVTYEIGVFGPLKSTSTNKGPSFMEHGDATFWTASLENQTPAVVGGFTHVFVDRERRRPLSQLPATIKRGLDEITTNPGNQAKL